MKILGFVYFFLLVCLHFLFFLLFFFYLFFFIFILFYLFLTSSTLCDFFRHFTRTPTLTSLVLCKISPAICKNTNTSEKCFFLFFFTSLKYLEKENKTKL